jgi:hypothetical protein
MDRAYLRAAAVENVVNVFIKCRTHLCDASIFGGHEYIPQDEAQNSGGEAATVPDNRSIS